jgi:DNA-binding GntR family transcriptional regulator
VGRTVARNLLLRAQALGLVTKADSAHWYIFAMNETRGRDLYELRIQLESCLIRTAASRIPADVLDKVEARLRAASLNFAGLDVHELDRLETDLHLSCISYGHNDEMIEALKRTHCTFVVGKHVQAALVKSPQIDPFVDEHLEIIEAIRRHRGAQAATAMKRHLKDSGAKAIDRLTTFRASRQPDPLPYLVTE